MLLDSLRKYCGIILKSAGALSALFTDNAISDKLDTCVLLCRLKHYMSQVQG
jgi:hypothetical protein